MRTTRFGRLVLLIAALPLLAASTVNADPFDWNRWAVAEMEAMPEVTRKGSRLDQARYLVSRACDRMAELGMTPNDSLADRAAEGTRRGSRGTTDDSLAGVAQGTCEDVEGILRIVLAAPGQAAGGWQIGVPTSAATHVPPGSLHDNLANVNRNHVAQALEIEREIYVFDPWMSSHVNSERRRSFADFGGNNEWNGKPIRQWAEKMDELGYDRFQLNLSYPQGDQDFTRPPREDIDEVVDYYLDDLEQFFGADRSGIPMPGKSRNPGTRPNGQRSAADAASPDIASLGAMVQRPDPSDGPTGSLADPPLQDEDNANTNRSGEATLLDLILGPDFALETGPRILPDDVGMPPASDTQETATQEDQIEPLTLRGTIDPASRPRVVAKTSAPPVTLRIQGNRTATIDTMRVTTSASADGTSVTAVETIQWKPAAGEAIRTQPPERPDGKPVPVRVDFHSTTTLVARTRVEAAQLNQTAEIVAQCSWRAERQADGNWSLWLTGSKVIKTAFSDGTTFSMPLYENTARLLLRPVAAGDDRR